MKYPLTHVFTQSIVKCPPQGGSSKEVSKCHPKTLPKSCNHVIILKVLCEINCDWAFNQMLFQGIPIDARSSHMKKYNKSIVVRFRSALVSSVVLGLPPRGGF